MGKIMSPPPANPNHAQIVKGDLRMSRCMKNGNPDSLPASREIGSVGSCVDKGAQISSASVLGCGGMKVNGVMRV